MAMRYIENKGTAPIFMGGKMIEPGTGREIDEAHLPPEGDGETPPEEEEPDPHAALRALLAGNVKNVSAALPALSPEDLQAVAALEGEAETPRKGVLAAVAELQLQRAQLAATGGEGTGA